MAGSLPNVVANAASGDTIQFDSGVTGTITLSMVITIDKSLTIQGPGAAVITVSGGNSTQLFDITGEGVDVSISGLTLTKGNAEAGGAILDNGHSLTLTSDILTDNTSLSNGGAISASGATLTLIDCTLSGNTAGSSDFGGIGGAISTDAATTMLTDCTLEDNTAAGNFISSGSGGALFASNDCNTLTLTNTTLAFNQATGTEGVISSQINDGGNGGGAGGAIDNNAATFTLTNCTLTGNTATGGNGGSGIGGAVFDTSTTTTYVNCTLANNLATGIASDGGAIFSSRSTLQLLNTIVYDPSGATLDPDISGSISASQNSLFGSDVSGQIGSDLGGNQFNANPVLGSLQDNGGPVPTMALLTGSPAIDAGAGSSTIALVPTTDARGEPRPDVPGTNPDIGAFEVQVSSAGIFSLVGVPIKSFEFSALNNVVVATFLSGNGTTPANTFTASIGWGDGTTSVGMVVPSGGGYQVLGSHTYMDERDYTITISVSLPGFTATTTAGATILEQLLPNGTQGTADQRFISELYRDFLGRQVDQYGLDYWTNALNYARGYFFALYFFGAGLNFEIAGTLANEEAEFSVVRGIESSAEYQARPQPTGTPQQLINYDYQLLLDRAPDPKSEVYLLDLEAGISNDVVLAMMVSASSQEYYNKTLPS